MQENKSVLEYVAHFFSCLSNGFCTFYEKESGSRTVFIEFLNIKNLDLRKLKTISILFLPGNHISDITVLSLVENIEYLNLKDNQITDLTPLKDLPGLKYLDLSYNPVTGSNTREELKRKLGENLVI